MNQLLPVLVSLEFDAITPAKSISKQIIEPKNNKIPKSPAFTNNLQMIKTENTNPIRLRFSSNSSEPSPLGYLISTIRYSLWHPLTQSKIVDLDTLLLPSIKVI